MGVGRFIEKLENGSFLSINGWKAIVFVEKWVGECRFCQKVVGSRFFS